MKLFLPIAFFFCVVFNANAQQTTISGFATDSTNGFASIEIVVNDTLSRLMTEPKKNRPIYLKLYQNPRYVVRTDNSGRFKITASLNDIIYFKSYEHKTQAIPVRKLATQKDIKIVLLKD